MKRIKNPQQHGSEINNQSTVVVTKKKKEKNQSTVEEILCLLSWVVKTKK